MKKKPDIAEVQKAVPEATNLREIGSGGFKVVYLANVGGQPEALKLVSIPVDENDESVEEENKRRIAREINILGDCATPFLVKLGEIESREVVIDDETFVAYSEEYVPGQSLRDLINTRHVPTAGELAEVGLCLLSAVEELSSKKVIHRDIKPDNIMKTSLADRPFILLDLGIAFSVGGTPLTRDSGRIPGTLYYIAPEMLDQGFRQSIDYRADLYTIGLTLYEYACGENPFKDPSDQQYTTLYRIKTKTPPSLSNLRNDLPIGFCTLVEQLMKKLPALRPASLPALTKRMGSFR